MMSTVQGVGHQIMETATAIRPEIVTGSHIMKVIGYSMTKGRGTGKYIKSNIFTIGGYDWEIRCYPDGYNEEQKSFISFYIHLASVASDVMVKFTFTILQPNGVPSDMSATSGVNTLKSSIGTYFYSSGVHHKRTEFEASKCLKDDAFTLKCTLTVVKGIKQAEISLCRVIVPPSNLSQNWADLLESGKGADVTFVVKGEKFKAHRCVLAARSAVFNALFFGSMKENKTDTITIDDIEAPVFKSMLYFIYSDSIPELEGTTDDEKKNLRLIAPVFKSLFHYIFNDSRPELEGNQDQRLMAQHLLVAADRFALERLRLICEDVFCKNLCVSNAATTLIMAEQHSCRQLKEQCFKFMSSFEVMKEVSRTPEFLDLMKVYPSVLKDIKTFKL